MTDQTNEDTYSVALECSNCGHHNIVKIPRGVRVITYLNSAEQRAGYNVFCSYCECKVTVNRRKQGLK